MPSKPLAACRIPTCAGRATHTGLCARHRTQANGGFATAPGKRLSARKQGYDGKWEKARTAFLRDHPTCQLVVGCTAPSTVVDHTVPHKGDMRVFWNKRNWRAACAHHHNQKTATRDGGFGRNAA